MKRCFRCGQSKPINAFAKDKSRRDGLQPRCRQCTKEVTTIWRDANRERIRMSGAIYRANNPEKRKASVFTWDSANRERNRARHRADRIANPDKYRARSRAYSAANRDKETAKMARWRAANPDVAREALTRYRTMKRKAFVAPVNRKLIYERDDGVCQICLESVSRREATLDHIIPLSRGGTHQPSNVQIAHGRCNSSKGAKIVQSHAKVKIPDACAATVS